MRQIAGDKRDRLRRPILCQLLFQFPQPLLGIFNFFLQLCDVVLKHLSFFTSAWSPPSRASEPAAAPRTHPQAREIAKKRQRLRRSGRRQFTDLGIDLQNGARDRRADRELFQFGKGGPQFAAYTREDLRAWAEARSRRDRGALEPRASEPAAKI